jgi:hypothetical protein
MKAKNLLLQRMQLSSNSFVELRIWQTPRSVRGSDHFYKYALAYVVNNSCVIRYDNEAGKGDHKHIDDVEISYSFKTPKQLLIDFWHDVDLWRP